MQLLHMFYKSMQNKQVATYYYFLFNYILCIIMHYNLDYQILGGGKGRDYTKQFM